MESVVVGVGARAHGERDTCHEAVAQPTKVKAIKAAKTSTIKVKHGKTKRLSVAPTPPGGTLTKMHTFKSSNSVVATVDKTGLITAKKKGETKLTVSLAGKKTTLLIRVT
ncbi:MAG: Ig-like domain-containing protein [Micrococcales bacterium]|nr:Ig-like domain-containing protein [Micrococcales bacterium]